VGATSPGKAAFAARAFRSISGRVVIYNTTAGRYVPVDRAQVMVAPPGSISTTDALGRYLFRDLAAGSYSLSVQNEPSASPRQVRLSGRPVDLTNVDFEISRPAAGGPSPPAPLEKPQSPAAKPPGAAAPAALIAEPEPPAAKHESPATHTPAPAVLPAKLEPPVTSVPSSIPASAERHHALGRQLSAAGRYHEAIAELTEALRLAPDFALALNARGFARFKLHDGTLALKDLDQAIRLNPKYANAYRIRAFVRKSRGDARGAAADLAKSRRLAH